MKKFIILFGLLAVTGGVCHAQNEKGLGVDAWWQVGTSSSEFKATEITVAPRWSFDRTFYVRLPIEESIGLWDTYGLKTWRTNYTIGPSLGANVYRLNGGMMLSVAVAAGRSFQNNKEWSYAYYDFGAEMSGQNILVGLGVRHYDSKHRMFRDRTSLYVKLGWRLF